MNSPRVSIIIPVYNVEAYVEECLQSVADQSIASQLECIIVDDCGTDGSLQRVEGFLAQYQGPLAFRLFRHAKNGGLSAARNTGIREATGEYLYLLDSDDRILPECMERMLRLADKHGGVDLLPALYITERPYMRQFSRHSFPAFSADVREIKRALLDFDRIPVTAANRLIRRTFLLQHALFFKEGIIHEDNHWTYFLAKHVRRMAFLPEKVYFYREVPSSITGHVNLEKEIQAYRTLITDFCRHIDPVERGAQKRLIFLTLRQAIQNRYYATAGEGDALIALFWDQSSWLERLLLPPALSEPSRLQRLCFRFLNQLYQQS